MPYVPFAHVDGIDVLLYPGTISIEPGLYLKDGDKKICMTINSTIYENALEEFFLQTLLSEPYLEMANKVVDELAGGTTKVGLFTMFTLKRAYKEKLLKIIDEHDKLNGY